MVSRPARLNPYEFAVVSALRTHQLMAGCVPLLAGTHKATMMAQMEVATGKVARLPAVAATEPQPQPEPQPQ